jgi:16S rRNA (adenine1518-N6/adenine1519-N6)-dimethyltransferase
MNPAPLGQHFLINRNVAGKIVQRLLPAQGPILEIGPGKGILSESLLSHAPPNRLILVEKDRQLYEDINQRLGEYCRTIRADILDIDLAELAGNEHMNIIGNIPYYISSELIDWIINQSRYIRGGILMMQREFVAKITDISKQSSIHARGLMFRALFQSEKIADVRPGSFSPPPRVTSTVFAFYPRPDSTDLTDRTGFYGFLRQAFGSRRKTLFNNLSGFYGKQRIAMLLNALKIPKDTRAQQLDLPEFLRLYSNLTDDR